MPKRFEQQEVSRRRCGTKQLCHAHFFAVCALPEHFQQRFGLSRLSNQRQKGFEHLAPVDCRGFFATEGAKIGAAEMQSRAFPSTDGGFEQGAEKGSAIGATQGAKSRPKRLIGERRPEIGLSQHHTCRTKFGRSQRREMIAQRFEVTHRKMRRQTGAQGGSRRYSGHENEGLSGKNGKGETKSCHTPLYNKECCRR